MNNIFQIGGEVKGKSFIGRTSLIEYFKKLYLYNSTRTGKAIVGLTRFGKSSFAHAVFNDIPENVIYIYEDLKLMSSYEDLWIDICSNIKDYLDSHNLCNDSLKKDLEIIINGCSIWIRLVRTIGHIFKELANLNIKTILVLDEFDHAASLFSEGTKHFELFREIFSKADYNVSPMTISRSDLNTIEGTTFLSSTFHGVLDSIYFTGFDDIDMEQYYEVFNEIGIHLSVENKKQIEWYAGRSPYLLSILGHYLIESYEQDGEIDIDSVFSNKCKAINDYYRDCICHLEKDDNLKKIIPFIIGPNIGVTKKDKDELINLGFLRETEKELIAISSYFKGFLSLEKFSFSVWEEIKKKKKSSEMINLVHFYKVFGEDVMSIQRGILQKVPGIIESDIARYEKFKSSSDQAWNSRSSFLDVMSFSDCVKIIKDCWGQIFSKYFNYDKYEVWGEKFNKCAKARNPIAHGHEEYLSSTDKSEIDIYCKQIVETISTSDIVINDTPDYSIIIEECKKYLNNNLDNCIDVKLNNYETILDSNVIYSMCITEVKTTTKGNKNIIGLYEDKTFVISKQYIHMFDLSNCISQNVKVKILNFNQGRYFVEPIDIVHN